MTSRNQSQHLARRLGLLVMALSLWGGAEGSAEAEEAPRYMTSEEDISDLDVVKLKNRSSVTFHLYSIVPPSRPFEADIDGTTRPFRYQISGGYGAEFAYKLQTNLELGLSVSYEIYESRVDQGASTQILEFSDAHMRLFPVVGIARWQWAHKFWSTQAEIGVGAGIYNVTVDSTNVGQEVASDSSTSLLSHAAAGLSLAWLDDTTIGTMIGYRQMFLGAKDLDAGDGRTIRRKSLSGLYAKANIRYQF